MEVILKSVMVIFILLSVFVVITIWRNPSAENNATQIATLVGAIILVIISVYPYLKKDEKTQFSNFVLFRDTKTDELVAGRYDEPYQHTYMSAFGGIGGHGTVEQISYPVSKAAELDFIEKAVVLQLLRDFAGTDWDADIINYYPLYNTGGSSRVALATGTPYILLDSIQLKEIFSGNQYLNAQGFFTQHSLRLPPKTTLKRIVENNTWTIVMENPEFKLVIQPYGFSGGTLMGGAWGIFQGDRNQYNRYEQSTYNFVIKAETKPAKRYTALSSSYWKWYDNIVKSLKTFDWEKIDKSILEKKTRDAVWQDTTLPVIPPGAEARTS